MRKVYHWNSFTTDFFLETSCVEARLEEHGTLDLGAERLHSLEFGPPRCFKCGLKLAESVDPNSKMGISKTMRTIKSHYRACAEPLPQPAAVGSGQGACKSM
ncbi:unnamed protein product [Pylaiella littoralis]